MKNKVFSYIRVSSKEQNILRQVEAMKEYCQTNKIEMDERDIFIDKASGKDFNRESYKALRVALREGDTLIIKELDRLGRNMEMVKEEWKELNKQGINIIVIDNPILNTKDKSDLEKTLISNIVFELLAYMAEKERIKIKQRQREGIDAAKKAGKHLGRTVMNLEALKSQQLQVLKENYSKWKNKEITGVKFMEMLNLKKNSFYKIIKEYEVKLRCK
ncbi:recombinase family protein [Clostridium sp. ZS2-4]|uniref:recombinase family protein n=1 Tax=Clostridium sp. ZS2-4 TaxID=2987703 RepID=UPI00227AF61E|nr:recombinase family protein [Clostridium sp. ZS2-4]MCY6355377.1 recombinase family protein [Clostridium sp. ZS2-4]